jgi:hypothetical protein
MKPISIRSAAQQERRPAARIAAAIIAAVALTLLTAACGGSPAFTPAESATDAQGTASSPSAVAYSNCMRSHGVPNYPDPASGGQAPKTSAQELGVSSSQFSAAEQACQQLYPTDGGSFQQLIQECESTGDCPQTVVQQALNVMREYAQCIRSHGVPNFPDPTLDSEGRPFFNVSGAGISHQYTHSPQFASKDAECERLVGGSAGVPVPLG